MICSPLKIRQLQARVKELEAAVAAEREECAKVAETLGVYPQLNSHAEWYKQIRARGKA